MYQTATPAPGVCPQPGRFPWYSLGFPPPGSNIDCLATFLSKGWVTHIPKILHRGVGRWQKYRGRHGVDLLAADPSYSSIVRCCAATKNIRDDAVELRRVRRAEN